jgi:tellurite resistance protein TerB|nr:MAG TPA: Tellurite resistance protein [Caudoviricetes sp.]
MGLFGFGKKKVSQKVEQMREAAGKIESKDTVEAGIAVMVGVAFADKTCSDEEIELLEAVIESDDTFAAWRSETQAMTNKWIGKFQKFHRGAMMDLEKEFNDLKGDPAGQKRALLCGIAVAEDEEGIGPEERAFLEKVAGWAGIRLESIL